MAGGDFSSWGQPFGTQTSLQRPTYATDESDANHLDASDLGNPEPEPAAAGQVLSQDAPVFASNHLDPISISNIPGHPEGEISPGADVRILNQRRVVMQGETLCQYPDGSQMIRWRGHIENSTDPDSLPDFMRVINFEKQVYFDVPLFVNNGVKKSFQFSYRTQSISNFALFIPISKEAVESAQPWGVAIPWESRKNLSVGFLNITNPVGNSITWPAGEEDIPECEQEFVRDEPSQDPNLASRPFSLPSDD